ncbi:MAG: hypothetical protein Q9175_003701, partial [Cornicularia normoerica]
PTTTPLVPFESPTDIGVFEGLLSDAFSFSSTSTLLIGGIEPHTPPIAILTTEQQQATNGTPTITVIYSCSTSAAFSLYGFWFGCAVHTDEAMVGVAVSKPQIGRGPAVRAMQEAAPPRSLQENKVTFRTSQQDDGMQQYGMPSNLLGPKRRRQI